jgi:protein gp37
MAHNTGIEWTETTWNPVTGCTKISPGCKNCYAERMALRLQAMSQPNYRNGFKVTLHERMLPLPLMWRKPRMIFVNSMSDLFHKDIPTSFIEKTFTVMRKASWHTFQVLTKRSERLLEIEEVIDIPNNVWLGVSVECEDYLYRIDDLRKTGANVKFLSLEPLIGPLSGLDLNNIDWVIVGGESGPGARPIREEWVTDIRDTCLASNVPFFFKQWGGRVKKQTGRILEGRTWDQMPELNVVIA